MDADKVVSSRINDLYGQARRNFSPVHTAFYSPSELAAVRCDSAPADLTLFLWGGHPSAERKVAAVWPGVFTFDDPDELNEVCGISILRISNTAGAELTHRDYLGALMSSGIDRSTVGDILTHGDEALVFVSDKLTSHVASALDKIARCRVAVEKITLPRGDELAEFLPKKVSRTVFVPSMRLDCIAAETYGLSRSDAQKLIASEKIKVDHVVCTRSDKILKEGELCSVSGKGRFEIGGVNGTTKKDNLRLEVFIFV